MSRVRCAVVLCLAVVLSVLCISAFAQAPVPAADNKLALLPEPSASPPPAQATEQPPPAAPAAEPPKQIAQLFHPAPVPGSAADLVDQAMACDWARDYGREAEYLLQVSQTYSGAKDAGNALVLLAQTYCKMGRAADAQEVLARVSADYADSEVQAFANTMAGLRPAIQSKSFDTADAVLLSACDAWRGTELGAWAALALGDLHRDEMADYSGAIAYYDAAAKAYPGTLVAQEAEVAIAECLCWSWEHTQEATDSYTRLLDTISAERLRTRVLIGLADSLGQASEYCRSLELYGQFIEQNPDDPAIPMARIYRAYVASRLGYWDTAVQDAQAFMAAPIAGTGYPWVSYAHQILGQDAFRGGYLTDAEAHFSAMMDTASNREAKARSWAGVGLCRAARGDWSGALQAYLQAAEFGPRGQDSCVNLYRAAGCAQRAGDTRTVDEIKARMATEYPGDRLTTRLLGYEVLPPPPI